MCGLVWCTRPLRPGAPGPDIDSCQPLPPTSPAAATACPGCRFFARPLAELITCQGRDILQSTVDLVQELGLPGLEVSAAGRGRLPALACSGGLLRVQPGAAARPVCCVVAAQWRDGFGGLQAAAARQQHITDAAAAAKMPDLH
jgi:hypothetical protein